MEKTSKTVFEYLGKDERLEGRKLNDFVKFMMLRLPYEHQPEYIREWATRFRNDSEWFHADGVSRKVLLRVNPERYKAYQKTGM